MENYTSKGKFDKVKNIWETKGRNFRLPENLLGLWGDKLFYTLSDDRSVLFFISASKVKVNVGKIKKSEESSYITVAMVRSKCKEETINGVRYWIMNPDHIPPTVSCPTTSSDIENFVRNEIASELDKDIEQNLQ